MGADTTPAAQKLAEFLTARDSSYHGSKSPLEARVNAGIVELAGTIAAEVIAAHPELREVIRKRTVMVVAQALQDDSYLNRIVTDAVAKGLGQLVSEREEARN